VNVSLV
jgi:hypothetical protein